MADWDFIMVRLLIAGPQEAGKTSFLFKYCKDSFDPKYIKTAGLDFMSKNIDYNGDTYKLQIWDTPGDPRYASYVKAYYRGTSGFFLVFDANSEKSFDAIPGVYEGCKAARANAAFILVGNKSDLLEEDTIATDKAKKFAADNGIDYMLTSCKSGENIEEAVLKLVEKIFPPEPKGSIVLYQHGNFKGKTLELTESAANFVKLSFNDVVSSVKVTSGTWRLYQHVNFGGKYVELAPGSHNIDVFRKSIGNDAASSAKLV